MKEQLNDTRVIVFTRHKLTNPQHDGMIDIWLRDSLFGTEATHPEFQTEAASATLKTDADAQEVISTWIHPYTETMVFGVFPPIIRAELLSMAFRHQDYFIIADAPCSVRLFEAHSINRAPEGQPPRFEFMEWLETGTFEFE